MRAAGPIVLGLLAGISAWAHVSCGPAHPHARLDLRANGPAAQALVDEQGALYLAAGLPCPGGTVRVVLLPPTPAGISPPGSHTSVEGGVPVCWCDQLNAVPHEMLHAALILAGGDGDGEHRDPRWAAEILWPPGSRRPPWVVGLIGPDT